MALVWSSHADHRIYQPSVECGYPSPHEQSESRSRLLVKIHNSYCKALERLNVRLTPSMAALFLDDGGGGFCFGFLDPVSNIITNTIIPCRLACDRKRRAAAAVVTDTKLKDLERRSLDGLVTFLTRLFPYLADCEAVRYLLLADADVLVAAQIIALDRHMKSFGESLEALVMALKCAALAARHPDPELLVTSWAYLSQDPSCALDKLSSVVRRRSPSHDSLVTSLFGGHILPPRPPEALAKGTRELWHLVACRRPRRGSFLYGHNTGLKRVLLDAIHGFYLEALARLPVDELQSRYHRSLLIAGYCYGPFDPVSNIIVNTIWYDAMFPPTTHRLKMDEVCTMSLHRIGSRSLYGMISFLCTRYHHLDFYQAARHLLQADASLVGADPNLGSNSLTIITANTSLSGVRPDTDVYEAFKATAIAARHPKPDDQVNLFVKCEHKLSYVLSLLQGRRQLSSNDIQQISRAFCPKSSCSEQLLPLYAPKAPLHEHIRVSKKVYAVLDTYNHQFPETMYQVHVICGVNTQVSGPVHCPGGSTFAPHRCLRTHVNFTVTRADTPFDAGEARELFFAELSNDDGEECGTQSFCCPVLVPPPCSERIRCLFCDFVGTRIVHPISQNFHGRQKEFEKMVSGDDPCEKEPTMMKPYYTNMSIICQSDLIADEISSLKEDWLYADSFDEPKGDMDLSYMEFTMDDYTISDDSMSP